MDILHLTIVTPQHEALAVDASFVTVPTPTGTIGILPKHIPLVTALVEGEIKVVSNGKESYFAIGGGFMQVTKTAVIILVSRAVHADELNEAEIKKAVETARQTVKQKGVGIERAEAQAILRRSFLEMKVLRHKRRKMTASDIL